MGFAVAILELTEHFISGNAEVNSTFQILTVVTTGDVARDDFGELQSSGGRFSFLNS